VLLIVALVVVLGLGAVVVFLLPRRGSGPGRPAAGGSGPTTAPPPAGPTT
jgi:hypothetical protein